MPDKSKRRVVSCGACIYRYTDDGLEFLLVQSFKSAPRWGFPKGHVDPGESWEETAHREVYEEAGIKIKLIRPLVVCKTREKDVRLWLAKQTCDTEDPQPHDPDCEIARVAWHPAANVADVIHRYQMPAFEEAARWVNPLAYDEDVWIPVKSDAKIELIEPPSSDVMQQAVEDIEHVRRNIYSSLSIPREYLGESKDK